MPDFVAEELGKRAGLDPEILERARMDRRVQQLIQNLRSFVSKDRVYASDSLRVIGPAAEAAVPALIEALTHDDSEVRRHATYALRDIGPAAVPALIEALKDDDSEVRSNPPTL